MKRLIAAPDYAALLRVVRDAIGDQQCIIVTATRAAADELLWQHLQRPALGIERFTLVQLAAQLAQGPVTAAGLAPMSPLVTRAIVARAIHKTRKKLKYFAEIADTPGFVDAAAATIGELRLNAINPTAVAGCSEAGEDLAKLLRAYEKLRADHRLVDLAATLSYAAKVRSHRLLRLPIFFVDVPSRSRSVTLFAKTLCRAAPSVIVALLDRDSESQSRWEAILGLDCHGLAGSGSDTTLGRVRAGLFRSRRLAEFSDDSVACFSAPGESFECVEIARRILALSCSGTPFDRVAVLLRQPGTYEPLLEEAMRRAGIPLYLSHGSVRPDPAGRAFLSLLACAEEQCSASRFAEYLSLAQVPNPDDAPDFVAPEDELLRAFSGEAEQPATQPPDAPTPVSPYGWEQLLVDAAVIGGATRWQRRLEGLDQELSARLSQVDAADPAAHAVKNQREQLQALSRFALPLIRLLDDLPASALWQDWLSRLQTLARRSLRQPDGVLAVLSELALMGEVGPVPIEEVRAVLADRMGTLRRPPPPRRFGAVFAGPIEEVRGRNFDVVFLPGLAEGLFPRKVLEDPLLLDGARTRLSPDLSVNETRALRERLLLHIAAAAGTRFVVSYPRVDAALARPRVPSFYALEVVGAAQGTFPGLNAFEEAARQQAAIRLGWPAPRTPATAIDETEFDLAVMAQCLDPETADKTGLARHIVISSPTLHRSLQARWRRWEKRNDWTISDGLQIDPALLEKRHPFQVPYPVKALETYAACPYQFHLKAVYRLSPREAVEALEHMDPLTKGSMYHEVLHRFLAPLLPWEPRPLGELDERLGAVLDEVAREWHEKLAPAIERVWRSEVESLRADLRGWLRELTRAESWRPESVERGFEAAIEGFRLQGRVDLLERHIRDRRLRVTDHKTGRPPQERPVFTGHGRHLQPILYSLAMEQVTGTPVQSGRLFHATQRGEYEEIEVRVTEASRGHAGEALRVISASIDSGRLFAAPEQGACGQCDFTLICGPYEEERVRRKPLRWLTGLDKVRATP